MTNIPLNTVASIAGTSNAQFEAALPKARAVSESARLDRLQQAKERQRNEEVEDPADDAVLGVHDGQEKQGGQGKKNKHKNPVDIAELHQEDGTVTQVQSNSPPPPNKLDISA